MADATRKALLGQFYTSRALADCMVAMASPTASRVLEPSCGPGVFLEALAARGYEDITGIDIDPDNVAAAAARMAGHPGVRVRLGDFLATDPADTYDLIIGNPPYVHWNRLDPRIRERVRRDPFWTPLVNGEWDLLYLFIAWAVRLLRDGGECIFIVPYNWFTATYAASLRRYLTEQGQFVRILHFGEFKLFADAYPNCVIVQYRKGHLNPAPPIWVGDFSGRRGGVEACLAPLQERLPTRHEADATYDVVDGEWRFFTMPQLDAQEIWYLAGPEARRRAEEVERGCAGGVLGDIADVGVGLVSGCDAAFALTRADMEALPEAERAQCIQCVKAAHCRRYTIAGSAPFLFPTAADDAALAAQSPVTHAHLARHRSALEARYLAKRTKWYEWATVRNLALFARVRDAGKIFIPSIDRAPRPRFGYTEAPVLGAGDVVCIAPRADTREDVRYLLAWLNSAAVADWYVVKGSRTGQRARYTQSYLARVPTPAIDWSDPSEVASHTAIVEHVRRRIVATDTAAQHDLERAIDHAFARLLEGRRDGTPVAHTPTS